MVHTHYICQASRDGLVVVLNEQTKVVCRRDGQVSVKSRNDLFKCNTEMVNVIEVLFGMGVRENPYVVPSADHLG